MAAEFLDQRDRHRGQIAHGAVGGGWRGVSHARDYGRDRRMREHPFDGGLRRRVAGAGEIVFDFIGMGDDAGEPAAFEILA